MRKRLIGLIVSLCLLLAATAYPVNALEIFSDEFDREELGSDWIAVKGIWTIESWELNAEGVGGLLASGLYLTDFSVQVSMKIVESAGEYRDWVGIVARATNPNDDIWTSGYLVYLREDGRIELYTLVDGKIASAYTEVDTSSFVTVRADFLGSNIKVYVNDVLYINVDDSRYSAGYFSLKNYVTEGRFDDVTVENPVPLPPNVVPEPAPVIISLLFVAVFATYALIRHRKPSFERRM